MYCQHCGQQLFEDDKCQFCGELVPNMTDHPPVETTQNSTVKRSSVKKALGVFLFGIGGVLCGAALVIIYLADQFFKFLVSILPP